MPDARERIIVALDVESRQKALDLVERLQGKVGCFKIGIRLFTAEGPGLVAAIVARGQQVFLDLKFFDIPNVVAAAVVEAARLGVSMLTIHALGGQPMMALCREKIEQASQREGWPVPLLVGVTVLTSWDESALRASGIDRGLDEMVLFLARGIDSAGLSAMVASAREVALLRNSGFRQTLITPGIRPAWSSSDDQKRTLTPSEAIRQGADYLVIGRPITGAPDPVSAVEQILGEIDP